MRSIFRTEALLASTIAALLLFGNRKARAFAPTISIPSRPRSFLAPKAPFATRVLNSRAHATKQNGRKMLLSSSTQAPEELLLTVECGSLGHDVAPQSSSSVATRTNGDAKSSFPESNTDIQKEKTKSHSNLAELVGLGTWMTALSAFLLINNFYGPFPANILSVPAKTWPVMHAVSAMLFGGGIILTTCIEWLVAGSKNPNVLQFWFGKVPALDSLIVLPALTASIVSGTALSIDHYHSLADAPFHVTAAITTLAVFAGWWAVTDLTTQPAATKAIEEWITTTTSIGDVNGASSKDDEIPSILNFRKFSNVVSCFFVAALYGIMVIKPGM